MSRERGNFQDGPRRGGGVEGGSGICSTEANPDEMLKKRQRVDGTVNEAGVGRSSRNPAELRKRNSGG